jgi:hypothetical protein
VYAFNKRSGTKAPGDAEMAHYFLVARLNQRLYCAAFAKYLVDVFLNSNIVQLPGVDVIGVRFRKTSRFLRAASRVRSLVLVAIKTLSRVPLRPFPR